MGPTSVHPLVGVVTPVYNGEAYLAECIESVLAQTYGAWEYVVADNASTDATWEIAQAYAARDPRIRAHRFEEYLPVIPNWNRTLRLQSPECRYCKFVLADDWLYPECLERMVDLAVRRPEVGLVGAYRLEGAMLDGGDVLDADAEVMPGRELLRRTLLGGPFIFGSPSTVMFRADLIRERAPCFFDEGPVDAETGAYVNFHADSAIDYALLEKSDFGLVHQVLSYSRVHEATISKTLTMNMGTWVPGHLAILMQYGPGVAPRDALVRRARSLVRRYEWSLAKSAVKGRLFRDTRYRAFHREALRQLRPALARNGIPSSGLGVAAALLR